MKKRVLLLSSLLATSLFATEIEDGWSLKGATTDMNVTDFSCAKAIWKYDENSENKWSFVIEGLDSQDYGYGSFNSISKGEGYWILGEDCNTTTTDESIVYDDSFDNSTYGGFLDSPANFINVLDEDEDGFDVVTKTSSGYEFTWYELDNGSWVADEDKFIVTLSDTTKDSTNYVSTSGEEGSLNIESFNKVDSINGNSYSGNLYEYVVSKTTTKSGEAEWEEADWTPTKYDTTSGTQVTITNIEDFLSEALAYSDGYWFSEANSGVNMLVGSGTSGDVVRGVANGTYSGCTSGDCTRYTKTTETIGSWELSNGVLTVNSDESNEYFYYKYENSALSQGWKIKEGSVEKLRWFFDDTDSSTTLESFIKELF